MQCLVVFCASVGVNLHCFLRLECFIHFQNSVDDEFVISTARKCNKYTDKLVIFDARSMFAAGGNMLKVR